MYSQRAVDGGAKRWLAGCAVALATLAPLAAADWLEHVPSTDSTIFYHNLSDRIAVLQRSRLAGTLPDDEAIDLARLLHLQGQLVTDVSAMGAALDVLRTLQVTTTVQAVQAAIYLSLHRFEDADKLLAQMNDAQASVLQAESWWNRGRQSAAWRQLDQLLEDNATPLLYARKGVWLMEQGQFDLAQQQLELARAHLSDPHPLLAASLYLGQARLLTEQGKHEQAYLILLAALQRLPLYVPLLDALATAEVRRGERTKAIERLRLAISLSPDPHLLNHLTHLLPPDQQGPWLVQAERRYVQMMHSYPQVYAAGAAQFYFERARYRDAERALSSLRPSTRSVQVWVLAATIDTAAGNRLQALDALRAARRSGQYVWKPYCQAAALYSALSLPDDAAAMSAAIANHGGRACPSAEDQESNS
ncbi:hypothetical protein GTP46_05940 [Duganella sp. FT135W]|uniref:Uncharacterized protein n=1 Tax=Duganella flavida TaxID=2692175 RepID=A0A6L8K4M3_9BURK|nr:hypothetical protein [Duganella flavida]MYM22180.1 hypothetical protein [Duganella flavida]